jgi:hypothetical protein
MVSEQWGKKINSMLIMIKELCFFDKPCDMGSKYREITMYILVCYDRQQLNIYSQGHQEKFVTVLL